MALPQISNEQLFAFVRKNPVGVGCAILCAALGVFYYFRLDALPAAEQLLQSRTEEASRFALNIRNASQLKEQSDLVFEAAALIDKRIVRASELATNLSYFYKLENETGVKLGDDLKQNVIPPPARGAPPTLYVGVPYSLSVKGDFLRLLAFLRKLEHDTYFCRINAAAISSPPQGLSGNQGDDMGEEQLTLSLSLELLGTP